MADIAGYCSMWLCTSGLDSCIYTTKLELNTCYNFADVWDEPIYQYRFTCGVDPDDIKTEMYFSVDDICLRKNHIHRFEGSTSVVRDLTDGVYYKSFYIRPYSQ